MRIGFALPNIGPFATPEAVIQVAQRAEALGYASLWTIERLLFPVQPQTPYPATPDGHLPEEYKHALDPVDTLTFAAAHTRRIALGTSVIDIPYYNPVVLARRLSTLDFLSGGRLRVGFGLGWSKDEFDAVGASLKTRGAVADEFLRVLKAVWTTDPVEFRGMYYTIPRSIIQPKPVQKPHPPIYMAAFAPQALQRIARLADGWNPVGLPVEVMAQMWAGVKETAEKAGRHPNALQLIVRANLYLTDKPLGKDRSIFTGSLDQIKEDTEACRRIGAHEVHHDPTFSPGYQNLNRVLDLMEQLKPGA